MISVLLGIVVNVLTRLSDKIGVSKVYVSTFLSILLGGAYYLSTLFFGEESIQVMFQHMVEIYATSQVVYNFISKLEETGTEKKKK